MTTDKTAVRKVTRKRGAKAQKAPLKAVLSRMILSQ